MKWLEFPQFVLEVILEKFEILGINNRIKQHTPFKTLELVDIKTALNHSLTQSSTRTLDVQIPIFLEIGTLEPRRSTMTSGQLFTSQTRRSSCPLQRTTQAKARMKEPRLSRCKCCSFERILHALLPLVYYASRQLGRW